MHNDKVNALQDKLRQVGILGEFADVSTLFRRRSQLRDGGLDLRARVQEQLAGFVPCAAVRFAFVVTKGPLGICTGAIFSGLYRSCSWRIR